MSYNQITTFIPGHVSLLFSPFFSSNPLQSGSTGAGINISDGVTFTASISDESKLILNGSNVDIPAVTTVLNSFSQPVQIEAKTNLPLGAGFGLSGAISLGSAISAYNVLKVNKSMTELISLAHQADVSAGTGLGDVMSQARGGVPIRLNPGGPGHGTLTEIESDVTIEYISLGSVDTNSVLSGNISQIQSMGKKYLDLLLINPSIGLLFDLGYDFATNTNLITPAIDEIINSVIDNGGKASMAMLGETVIALETGLSDAGYTPKTCTIYNSQPHLIQSSFSR